MASQSDEDSPPHSTDLEGWRRAVRAGVHSGFPMETVVAAVQDLGPEADTEVMNALVLSVSEAILRILRRHVGRNHTNQGADIIDDVHGQLIGAVLAPHTADGKGLREAFVPRIRFRAADAIRTDQARRTRERSVKDFDAICDVRRADDMTQASEMDERLHVEDVLSRILDDQKRLAFRMYMEGIPLKSGRSDSISKALGISSKTAGLWIEEVQAQLGNIVGGES